MKNKKAIVTLIILVAFLLIVASILSVYKYVTPKTTILDLSKCAEGYTIIDREGKCYKEIKGGGFTDGTNVLHGEAIISNIDVDTAESLNKSILKDKNGVYYIQGSYSEKIVGIDPEQAYAIYIDPNSSILTDNKKFYVVTLTSYKEIPSATLLQGSLFIKGSDVVYYGTNQIIGASPDYFEVIEKGALFTYGPGVNERYFYAKDKNHVYYKDTIVPQADPLTFEVYPANFRQEYAKDGVRVYFENNSIPNADPKSFEVFDEQIYEGCMYGKYAKDSQKVFYGTTTLSGAEVKTFESLPNGYGKDSYKWFKDGVEMSDSPSELETRCPPGKGIQ